MDVLLGVSDGAEAFDALEETLERVRAAGDDLTIAVFVTPETTVDADDLEARVEDELDDTGVDADIRRLSGDPGNDLVALAESEGFDRIVLGGGGRSPLGKITLDEVTEFVLLNAETSVTLVR